MRDSDTMPKGALQRFVETWQVPVVALLIFAGLMTGLAVKWLEMDRLNERVEANANDQEKSLEELSKRVTQIENNVTGPVGEIITRRMRLGIQEIERGVYDTQYGEEQYPVAAIIGWHMICAESENRDIESVLIEQNVQGKWSIYVEHRSDCTEIYVYLMFIGKTLVKPSQSAREPTVSSRVNWKILTAL